MLEKCNLVAVYGSLLSGLGNHPVIQGSKFVAHTETKDMFKIVDYARGCFPAVTLDDAVSPIVVEVYEVEDEWTARRLDGLEGYPNFYNRTIVPLVNGMKAWIYHIEDKLEDEDTIVSGDWKLHLSQKYNYPV